MTQEFSDYARTYSAMADEELVELSVESASLVEDARQALQQEMDRRGLKPEALTPTKIEAGPTCPGCGRVTTDPLTCGSCSTSICRHCGTPLELEWSDDDDLTADDEATTCGPAGTRPDKRPDIL